MNFCDKFLATAPCVTLPPASMQSRMNDNWLIQFVVYPERHKNLSNHEWAQLVLRFLKLLVLMLACISPMVAKAESKATESISVSTDKQGKMGAVGANGKTIVPFKYDYVEAKADGFFIVGLPSKHNSSPLDFGIVTDKGEQILPIKYTGIDYDADKKRFKVRVEVVEGEKLVDRFGYFDEKGKVVIPTTYEYLERISNMGDEPTNIMMQQGKYGYIDIITGKVLIKPEYDKLNLESLNTDNQGRGIVVALKGNKWGILSTEGNIIAPFNFDFIGDISADGSGMAELKGKLVNINIQNGKYAGNTDVPDEYSLNFVPRLNAPIDSAPLDGVYITETYPTMKSAWDAWRESKLRWAAIPSIQISGDKAYVSFGIFAEANLPLLQNELSVSKQADGFTIMNVSELDTDATKQKAEKLFTFVSKNDVMECDLCGQYNLPVRWRLAPAAKPEEFGGIGVVLKDKIFPEDEFIHVIGVLKNGPADKSGLKESDLILKIDGSGIASLSTAQAKDKLRGKPATKVKVTIHRAGGSVSEIEIVREIVKIPR